MKKLMLLACLLTLWSFSAKVYAQLSNKVVPHLGFMWEVLTFEDGGCINDDRNSFYTLSVGTYYTLLHKNDVVSLGVDPSVNLGFNLVGEGFLTYVIQAPVYFMGRLGATATPYNQQKFGVGAGIGFNYTFFSEKVSTIARRNASVVVPTAVFEVTILSGGAPLTGRIHVSLGNANGKMKCNIDNAPGTEVTTSFGNFGFGLIYGI